jgi:hypothetical protein
LEASKKSVKNDKIFYYFWWQEKLPKINNKILFFLFSAVFLLADKNNKIPFQQYFLPK